MKRCYLALVLLVLFAAGVAGAQSTASITGVVTDPTGAVVPGAQVLIHGLDTGLDRAVTCDSGGVYNAPSMQPGSYSVKIMAPGFGAFTVSRVTLLVDQKTSVNAKLSLGNAGETVEVESTAPIMDTDTITVGQVIDQQTVQNIPLNGRHFLDLTNLTPGTVVPPVTGSLTVPSRGLGANSFNTAGAREDAVNFMVNGINLNDMSQNQITFQPSIDTTSSFKLDNSTYSAEYGRNSGAIVNVLTRSGTNQIHGNVFDYYRDQYFDGRNYFNRTASSPKSTFRRQNYGADLSGPIIKDRTFLFLSYEALRQEQGLLFNHTVLSAAQRAALAASPAGAAYGQLVNLIPVGNDATGTVYTGSSSAPVRTDQFSGDLLHKLSDRDTAHLFYAYQQDRRTEPNLQGNNVPGFGDHRTAHRQIGTINEVHVFSPRAVNEFRVGFSRIAISFIPNFNASAQSFGINTSVTTSFAIPQITVSDIGLNIGGPSGFPQIRFDTTGVVSDTATLTRGKHTLKIGGEFRRFIYSSNTGSPGTLTFPTTAAFIVGNANAFSVTPQYGWRSFDGAAGGFVDDSWKVTPRLLIETGFRFEWNGTPVDAQNRFINFSAATDTLQATHIPFDQNYNYEPRVGFSYDVFGTGKSVLRGGFAILTDQPTAGVDTGLAGNPPNTLPVSLSGTSIPVGTLNTAGASSLGLSATNPHFRDAYTESYNLNLQQALGSGFVAKLGYIGSDGRHLRLSRNINQYSPLGTTTRPFATLSGTSPVRPGAALGNITLQDSDSMSNYNAMWLTVQKNLFRGLEINTTYTLSKSMDINSLAGGGLQDNNNPAGNYGLSDFDVRHHFVFSGTYALPFHRNRAVDGFLLAVINQEQGGNPLNLVLSTTSYTGTATLRPIVLNKGYSTGRGVTTAAGLVPFINATVCVTPTVAGCNFYAQTAGFGNLQRNALTGPGFEDTDMSLQKTTKIFERASLVLRVDAFDIFNHVNFSNPNTTPSTSGTFGLISATRAPIGDAGSSRQLQFAGKLIF